MHTAKLRENPVTPNLEAAYTHIHDGSNPAMEDTFTIVPPLPPEYSFDISFNANKELFITPV